MDIDQVDAEVLYANATGGAEFYALDADACLAVVPGDQRRRHRVRVGRPETADPGVHPPAARHRVRVEGGAAHRQRRCACGAAAALPVRRRARAVLGRRLRPAVVGDRGSRHPDQPAHRRQRVPVRAHGPRPHAGEGHLPVAAVDVHGRGDGELAAPRHLRAPPAAAGRVRGGRARLVAVLPHPARPHVRPPRVGAAGHEPARAAEPLLAPEHVRHVRRGRVRRAEPSTRSASRTCSGPPTTRTPTPRGRSRSR